MKFIAGLVLLLSAVLAAPPAMADYVRIKGTVVNVRQGPGTTYPVLFQAEAGQEYDLLRTEGLWCLVSIGKDESAWVFGRLVEILPGERTSGAVEQSKPAQKDSPLSLLVKHLDKATIAVLLLLFLVLLLKRRALMAAAGRKLREVSGYRREQPFRYDNRNPRDDSWEL